MNRTWRLSVLLLALAPALFSSGCASAGRLGEHDFRDRTVGVVALNTPRPEILTNDWVDIDRTDLVRTALRVGADIAKEVQASRARPRLDEAARLADVEGRMMARVLSGAARELRARPVDDVREAEFELEVRVKKYGIDADDWSGPARFHLESEVVLRESDTGRQVWKAKVKESAPLTARIWGGGDALHDVMTAARLSSLSTEEMTHALEALADFAADEILDRLHRGLDKARSRAH